MIGVQCGTGCWPTTAGWRLTRPPGSSSAGRFRGGLHLLLVRADSAERRIVGDVGDREVRPLLAEPARGGTPALRLDAELLAQQGHRDLGLVGTEARQLAEPVNEVLAGGGPAPDRGGVAVVPLDQLPAEFLRPFG